MIKELEKFEIEQVMDIWLNTNITAHNFLPKKYWVNNYDLVKEQYIPMAKNFVYKEDGIIKGFISIIEDSFIGALFVSEKYQGQGIGKKLINHCKSLYDNLQLAVYSNNTPAVNFYKHCGFIIEKEQKNVDSDFMECIMSWSEVK